MKLYYMPGACSLATHIVLEWIGKPFETERITHAELKKPAFLAVNPLGAVPAIEDEHGVLTQNAAILGYLAELLLDEGYEVIGMVRRSSTVTFERIAHLQDRVATVPGDLLDQASLIDLLRTHRPTEVYNLAAQSFVQTSFSQPVLTGEFTALCVG